MYEEAFAADFAVVLELLIVAPLVSVERRLVDGGVVTFVALQLLLLRVLALVHLHLVRPLVRLEAHVAGVGPLLRVDHLVQLERLLVIKLLVALRAREQGQGQAGNRLVLATRVHFHLDSGRHRSGALSLLLQLPLVLWRQLGKLSRLMVHLVVLVEPLPAGQHQVAVRAGEGPGGAAQRARCGGRLQHGGNAVRLLC